MSSILILMMNLVGIAAQVKRITDPKKQVHQIKDSSGNVLATINAELHMYYDNSGTHANEITYLKYKLNVSGSNNIKVTAVDLLHKDSNTTWQKSQDQTINSSAPGEWSNSGRIPGYKWTKVYMRIYIHCPADPVQVYKTLKWDPTVSGGTSTKLE